MMRHALAILMACALTATARADLFDPPGMFSGVETLFLRSGTLGYEGNVLRGVAVYIAHESGTTDTTLTDVTFGSPLTPLVLGIMPRLVDTWGDDWYMGDHRLLWRPDISDIPDSALIVRARLFIRPGGTTANWSQAPSPEGHIKGYRLMRDWDPDNVTWNQRFDHPDSTWFGFGPVDSLGIYDCHECPDSSLYVVHSQITKRGVTSTTHTTLPYFGDWGIGLDILMDNMHSGYGRLDGLDYVREVVASTSVGTSAAYGGDTTPYGWIAIDVTRPVSMWHYGVWANYGLLLKAGAEDLYGSWSVHLGNLQTLTWRMRGDRYTEVGNEAAAILLRPLLVIEYLYAQDAPAGGFAAGNRRRGLQRQWIGWSPEALD